MAASALVLSGTGAAIAAENHNPTPAITQNLDINQQKVNQVLTQARNAPEDGVIHETNGLRWKVVKEPTSPRLGTAEPMFSVGLGKYIYIYLTNSDWTYIQSGAFGGASSAVCYLIGGGPIAGFACGVVGGVIGNYIADKVKPSRQQCGELKLAYVPPLMPVGYKIFKKPCSQI